MSLLVALRAELPFTPKLTKVLSLNKTKLLKNSSYLTLYLSKDRLSAHSSIPSSDISTMAAGACDGNQGFKSER